MKQKSHSIKGFLALALGVALVGGAGLTFASRSADAETNPITQNVAAPELVGASWENTPNNAPLKLANLRGKVVILHFWTFGCINCKHNLPAYNKWQKEFAGKDVALIGVHTPETPSEGVHSNVVRNIKKNEITYPVLIDSKSENWNRWKQQFWPTVYLIDKHGKIRYRWEGELDFDNQDGAKRVAKLVRELENEK